MKEFNKMLEIAIQNSLDKVVKESKKAAKYQPEKEKKLQTKKTIKL